MATQKETPKLVIAKASHVLSSPRKTNLVLKAIVGRPASLAIKQLAVLPKRAAQPIAQLIKQAVGNAISQFQASPDSLVIHSAFATKGRTLKRAHIGGRGRTKPYERISSHLTLNLRILSPKVVSAPKPAVKSEVKAVDAPKKAPVKTTKKTK
jgi:large subunit ribosomal protein L22